MATVYILVYGIAGTRPRRLVPIVFETAEDAEKCATAGKYKPDDVESYTVDEIIEPSLTVQQLVDAVYIMMAQNA